MAKKLIVANWKMAPGTLREAQALFKAYLKADLKNIDLVVAPPFDFTEKLTEIPYKKSGIKFGAQDVFWENPRKGKGAYTGEISVKMLKDTDVEYVIVGHSERRRFLNETDQMINKKVLVALKSGLKTVLCVGENSSVRKKGKKVVENYIRSQLEKDLKEIKNLKLKIKNLVIAYEPIWAIGTGENDTPDDAVEISKFIKSLVVSRLSFVPKVLYGGSINGKNIKKFLQYKEIDGALVGGASINKKEFGKILKIINENKR